jgi:site-specific recombinase XerD
MKKLPEIRLTSIYHRREHQLLITFPYNEKIISLVKSIHGTKWSHSNKGWYLKNTKENLQTIQTLFKGICTIKRANLEPQKKSNRKLTEDNKNTLNSYYTYLKGKRYSKSTVETYTYLVADFIEFKQNKSISELNNRDVEVFIETVYLKRNYSISTQRQFISALKLFVTFIDNTSINNLELTRPKKSKILPTVLSQEEVLLLIQVTKNLKHRAIIALLYSAGLRIGELISLQLKDIDIERRQLFVRSGKGRKDRYVILADSFLPLLNNYFMTYKPSIYFVEGPKNKPYSASSIRKFLHTSTKLSQITKKVTPHTLRHSYATHLLENGIGLRYIQELLGHAKPETTMIYTHVAKKDLLDIKSPLDIILLSLSKNTKGEQKFLLSGNLDG